MVPPHNAHRTHVSPPCLRAIARRPWHPLSSPGPYRADAYTAGPKCESEAREAVFSEWKRAAPHATTLLVVAERSGA
eukprot:3886494-Prymnesium_polylepis.1